MNNQKYINPNYTGPSLIRGYLQKLKSENAKSRFLKKFNKRYFLLDLTNYYFGYKDKENSTKVVTYPLTDLINIDPNPRIIEVCDWKFAFVVQIGSRIYHLYADSVSQHNEWCNGLKACLKPLERLVYNEPQKPVSLTRNSPVLEQPYELRPVEPHIVTVDPGPETSKFDPQRIENSKKDSEEVRVPVKDQRKSVEIPQNALLGFNAKSEAPGLERSRSNPESNPLNTVSNQPRLEIIRANFDQDPVAKKKLQRDEEDEDEVTVLSGPKTVKKEEDSISQITPVIYVKDRPQSRGMPPIAKVEVASQPSNEPPLYSNKFVKQAYDMKVDFKPSGMLDMMNEFDNLGLENVQVRPVFELKKKLVEDKEGKKMSLKTSDVLSEKKVTGREKKNEFFEGRTENKEPERKIESARERIELRTGEFFENKNEKKGLGGIVVKSNIEKVKVKSGYVERPEVVPDEPEHVQKAKVKVQERRSEKQVFVEKNVRTNPQGTDCDWDEWDD